MIIKFKNWDKYNPKSSKTHSWFRLNNNIAMHQVWDELTHAGFRVFIYLLCQCNNEDTPGMTRLSTRQATRRCTTSEKEVNSAIEILYKYQVIEIRAPEGFRISSEEIPSTYERTNETNVHMPIPPEVGTRRVFDFNAVYQEYPRKEGKSRGLQICKAQIKTEADYQSLRKAIQRYREHIGRQPAAPQFVKHFSTFMNSWRDWLDPNSGTIDAPEAFDGAKYNPAKFLMGEK